MRIPLIRICFFFILTLISFNTLAVKPAAMVQEKEQIGKHEVKKEKKLSKKLKKFKQKIAQVANKVGDNKSLLFLSVFNVISGLTLVILFAGSPVFVILGLAFILAGFIQSITAFARREKSDFFAKYWFFSLLLPISILVGSLLVSLIFLF